MGGWSNAAGQRFGLTAAMLGVALCAAACIPKTVELQRNFFLAHGLVGTLLIENMDGLVLYEHNPERSRVSLSPASTFKILNTLIAAEEKAVANERSPFSWDGVVRTEMPRLNQTWTSSGLTEP